MLRLLGRVQHPRDVRTATRQLCSTHTGSSYANSVRLLQRQYHSITLSYNHRFPHRAAACTDCCCVGHGSWWAELLDCRDWEIAREYKVCKGFCQNQQSSEQHLHALKDCISTWHLLCKKAGGSSSCREQLSSKPSCAWEKLKKRCEKQEICERPGGCQFVTPVLQSLRKHCEPQGVSGSWQKKHL